MEVKAIRRAVLTIQDHILIQNSLIEASFDRFFIDCQHH